MVWGGKAWQEGVEVRGPREGGVRMKVGSGKSGRERGGRGGREVRGGRTIEQVKGLGSRWLHVVRVSSVISQCHTQFSQTNAQ